MQAVTQRYPTLNREIRQHKVGRQIWNIIPDSCKPLAIVSTYLTVREDKTLLILRWENSLVPAA